MNVVLTTELQRFVETQVQKGRYASADDLIASAVSRLQILDELQIDDIDDLREETAIGLDQADRQDFLEFDAESVIAEGRKILEGRSAN